MFIAVAAIMMVSDTFVSKAATKVTKLYEYGYSEKASWVSMGGPDDWNGLNYWCVGNNGSECGKFDWKAIYWINGIVVSTDSDVTPVYTNNGNYGKTLVEQAAQQQNIQLPPEILNAVPTYSYTIETVAGSGGGQ